MFIEVSYFQENSPALSYPWLRASYSKANASDNEDFQFTILQSFQLETEQKKTCRNESLETETKLIYASAANLLHIRIGNLDWFKCEHWKNKAREIDSLCCKEVDTILIAFAKIPEHEGSISPCSFNGQLDCY